MPSLTPDDKEWLRNFLNGAMPDCVTTANSLVTSLKWRYKDEADDTYMLRLHLDGTWIFEPEHEYSATSILSPEVLEWMIMGSKALKGLKS